MVIRGFNISRDSITGDYILLGIALSLAVFTVVALAGVDRFHVLESQVLQDPSFSLDDIHWRKSNDLTISAKNSVLTITSDQGSSRTVKQWLALDTPTYVSVSIEASTKALKPSDLWWAGAQASLIMYDSDGDRVGVKPIFRLTSPAATAIYERELYVPTSVSRIAFVVGLYRSDGTISVLNPVIGLLTEKKLYNTVRIFVVVCWLIFCIYAAKYLTTRLNIVWLFVMSICTTVLLFGVLSSEHVIRDLNEKLGETTPESVLSVLHIAAAKFYGDELSGSAAISKLGHFFMFFVIGLILGWFTTKIGMALTVVFILVVAFSTEALQMLVSGRTTSVKDIYVDLAGGIGGIIIGRIARLFSGPMLCWLTRLKNMRKPVDR